MKKLYEQLHLNQQLDNKETESIKAGYYRITELISTYSNLDKVPESLLQLSCERGTQVHLFCELYAKNIFMPFPQEELKGYFQSFSNWFDKYVDEVLFQETRLYDEFYKITGKFDFILKIKGNEDSYLVDLKTSQTPSKCWRMQVAAYRYMIEKHMNQKIAHAGCLILYKDGKEAKFFEYSNYENDFRMFESCLFLHKNLK